MASLRDQLPEVAAFIDEARAVMGKAVIDRQLKLGMQGKGTFYAAKLEADGSVLHIGSTIDGVRVHNDGGQLVWPERQGGWPVPEPRHLWSAPVGVGTPTPTPSGSSRAPSGAGSSSPANPLFSGPPKGVI